LPVFQVMKKQSRIHSLKLISIGNSKGVRLPKFILQKYGFSDTLLLEETDQGILLRQMDNAKLSWEETYREMAQEQEDWEDFENTLLDGLEMNEVGS
jgi:antitoxin MazE